MLNAQDRLNLYKHFSAFFSYPDIDFIPQLMTLISSEAATALMKDNPPPPLKKEDLLSLQTAYTSLFISRLGGIPAPPFGSVYLDNNRLIGASTLRVEQMYADEGLSLEGASEPADFLATELEFMFYLVEKELALTQSNDAESLKAYKNKQATFFQKFLSPWVPAFCLRIQQDPQVHPFYLWGSELLLEFCHQETQYLQVHL